MDQFNAPKPEQRADNISMDGISLPKPSLSSQIRKNESVMDKLIFWTAGRKIARTKLSETERAALEAGDKSIEEGFFDGRPQWQRLRELPKAEPSEEGKAFIEDNVKKFTERLNVTEIRKLNDLPKDVYEMLKDYKIWGMIIDKEYGGLGLSPTDHSEAVMMIGSMSAAAAVDAMVPNSLGPGELIMRYGTDEQKEKWLPGLANGKEIPCFALTSINGGSDAAGGMANKGRIFIGEDGRLKVSVDISNRYITLAPITTLAGVAFKLKDPDNLLGKGKAPGITVSLIPANTPNFITGKRHNPMDIPFQNGPVEGKDVVIDIEDNIIGGKDGAGKGWNMLMECLAIGRSISLPALSVAAAKYTANYVGSFSRIRKQFNTPICNFQGIQELLARIAGKTYIMDSARKTTLQMLEAGKKPTIPSAIIKYNLTEMMREICRDGMDIMGGSAIVDGPRNIMSDFYKSVPIAIGVEGHNVMTRNLLIFGQGLMRLHPNLYPMIKAAQEGDKAKFRKLMLKHGIDMARYLTVSEFGIGLKAGIHKDTPKELHKYYKQINYLSGGFAFSAAVLSALYQDRLKTEENICRRMGDVLSNLYMAMSVLNNFEREGMHKDELDLVHWSCQYLMHNAEEAFRDMLKNLKHRPVAAILKGVVFANCARYEKPSDELGKRIAMILTAPNETKDRLTKGIYRPGPGEKLKFLDNDGLVKETDRIKQQAIIDKALEICIAAEPLEDKLAKAVRATAKEIKKGEAKNRNIAKLLQNRDDDERIALLDAALKDGVIDEKELRALVDADEMRKEVCTVDAF